MELITLQQTDYKEKDAIVTALSEDGLVTFTVHGLKDPKSKNIILSTPLVYADVDFTEGKSPYKSIKTSKLLASPYKLNDDLNTLASISLISEATRRMLIEEEEERIYHHLLNAIFAFKEGKINPICITLIYLAKVLKLSGSEMEINHCIFCGGKKAMATFSFFEGGFICKDCIIKEPVYESFTNNQMKIIRAVFMLEDYREIPFFNEEDGMYILEKMINYIDEFLGVKLQSFKLF